ncbi:RNA-binding S4 domain-containing protein [Sulfurivermis fontis]|uniref:RNA-binding S4 domain-containing protein n=1 Tax=Sulfurivermis fontis TaxID=1972068 RepID=UPI000FDBA1C7|nr:RNA-binding S4 domain-containing protein [Sulfurivermis fontis]
MSEAGVALRLDKWLWAARFYKTRALAVEAINGGHVYLNGVRPKPSRGVQCGDELAIRKAGLEFVITVTGLSERRGPATAAQQLYRESEESRQRREALAEERRLAAAAGVLPARRPDKRGRRRIIRFTGRGV